MKKEKKNRIKGVFGTILFHALLLLLLSLPFMSLTYQDPPLKKGGGTIAINFSSQKVPEKNTKPVEEIVTQTTTEALVVKKPEKKNEEVIEEVVEAVIEEVIEEIKPEVNKKALYPGKKKTTVTFEGRNDDDDLGYVGEEGEGEGKGNGAELGNRNPIFLPEPIYDSEAEGKVVVRIIVDQFGNVISAITDIGTTLDNQLLVRAKEAAFKTKYPPKEDAPNQHGKLIYTFQKN